MTVPAADSQKQRGQTSYWMLKFPDPPQPTDDTRASIMVELFSPSIEAASKDAAIRAAAEKHGAGRYLAVPARSWKPQKVIVEQTTVVKVGDA